MTGNLATECRVCGELAPAGDRFCEGCGAPLTPGVVVDDPNHREIDTRVAAGVSDRGRVHRRNEDAMQIEALEQCVLAVVCDGVSSSTAPDAASAAAAAAAAEVLASSVRDGSDDAVASMRDAIKAAQVAVVDVPWTRTRSRGAPSCTFVGGRWDGREITVGSVGDSRAYWVDDTSAQLLTVDDSWAQEQVAEGLMSEAEAQQHQLAHAITRWLGEDAPDGAAQVTTFTPPTRGRLVLCSDGLWNYADTAERLGGLVREHPVDTPPLEVARALTRVALDAGGRDNITVVVIDVTPIADSQNREGS
jgi:PPM family protein phosphatase